MHTNGETNNDDSNNNIINNMFRQTTQATNAVHCTDLTEDGLLECQYMFGVVAKGRCGA